MERQETKNESCESCDTLVRADSLATKVSTASGAANPDHSASKKRINRIKGQLDAVSRMIDERKYCPSIIQQIRAATNALRSLEAEVLRGHLRGCVKKTMESQNPFEMNDKIEEILQLLKN
jgi:DNA-binding FrmR family transcriptional regulator